jgi:hypothetical protein
LFLHAHERPHLRQGLSSDHLADKAPRTTGPTQKRRVFCFSSQTHRERRRNEMVQGKLVRLRAVEPEDAERAYRWINDRP